MKKFLWCFTVVFSVLSTLTAQTRIAILGDIERNRAEIDMLTERFSKERNIALLERSEIDRIIAEQKLSLLSNSDAMKLGAMLGARGMIIIKAFEWEGKNILSARMVATKSGAILGVWIQDTPSKEAFHFADAVKFSFMPLISKLFLERKDIIALSLLNIRAAVDSPEAKELERKITLLLSQRLMYEKSFVVLERWRLSNIAWEKELNLDNNPFWTGSYILDGSVESLHDGKGTVKVVLRLRKPGEKEPTLIEVSGSTLELKTLVESMTASIVKKLGKDTGEAVSWNMKKEADFYFNEAQWLLRAGAFERAREAADAAFALGKTGPEIDFIRIKSYLGEMDSAGTNKRKNLFNAIRFNLPKTNIKQSSLVSPKEIEKLLQAFDIYVKFLEKNEGSIKYQDRKDWDKIKYELNKRVLYTIKKVFSEENCPEVQEKAFLLRLLFKKFISLTIDENKKYSNGEYLTTGIGIIFDRPEEAIAEYDRILSKEFPNPKTHVFILHFIAKGIQYARGHLFVWNSQDKHGNVKGHKFFVDVTEHFKQTFEKLDGTDRISEKIDALILAGNKVSKEKISSTIWTYRDQILDGDEKTGGALVVLIEHNQCPTETIVKILMYAFSQERLWNEYRIHSLVRRLLRYSNGHPIHNEYGEQIAKAFYTYYDKIKDKKVDSFTETKKILSVISNFRPEEKSINVEAPYASPVLSSSISGMFPKDLRIKIEKMSFQSNSLQISGYSAKGKFNCRGYLIYCNEEVPNLNLVVNETNLRVPSSWSAR